MDNLYRVIKVLSPHEKGYFRRYASRHTIGEKNIYLRLFEEIDKLEYLDNEDEIKIREKLRKHSRIENFSVLKGYLYRMILKSMQAYGSGRKMDSSIETLIDNHDFLFSKNLLKESYEYLMLAKKTAYKFEKLEKLLFVIKRERRFVRKTDPANVELTENLNKEAIEIIKKIQNTAEYSSLYDSVRSVNSKFGFTNTEVLKEKLGILFESEFLKNEHKAETFYSRLFYFQMHSIYHFILSENEKALGYFRKIEVLYESHSSKMKENMTNYMVNLLNCIDMCESLGKYDDCRSYFGKITEAIENTSYNVPENSKLYILSRSSILELKRHTNCGDFDENKQEIKEIRKKILQNLDKIDSDERIILTFQFVMYYFGCGNLSESLKWLNLILNNEEDQRADLALESRLLFLIIHYELKNYDLIEYAVKSVLRFLYKSEILEGTEQLFVNFIRKIGTIENQRELTELFIEFRNKLIKKEVILKKFAFDYLAWVESKISGVSYADVIKKNFIERANQSQGKSIAGFTYSNEDQNLLDKLEETQ